MILRDGKCLVTRRAEPDPLGGLWEFPGGKIEPGESALEAAEREVEEELGLQVRPLRVAGTVRHRYDDFAVELNAVLCRLGGSRESQPKTASTLAWFSLDELARAPIPEANHELIELITSTIAPNSWDKVGGPASLAPFYGNLSIAVSQTEEVHAEVEELVDQLRKLRLDSSPNSAHPVRF